MKLLDQVLSDQTLLSGFFFSLIHASCNRADVGEMCSLKRRAPLHMWIAGNTPSIFFCTFLMPCVNSSLLGFKVKTQIYLVFYFPTLTFGCFFFFKDCYYIWATVLKLRVTVCLWTNVTLKKDVGGGVVGTSRGCTDDTVTSVQTEVHSQMTPFDGVV